MKCPSCGAKMKDDHLYCEKCGMEIQIVPDFEPEVENSIYETLSDVAIEIGIDKEAFQEEEDFGLFDTQQIADRKPKLRWGWKPYAVLVFVFAAAIIAIYSFWSNQPDKMYQKAIRYLEEGVPEAALASFENAVSKETDNVLYLNGLADCCMELGDLERTKEICLKILELDRENLEAYTRLIRIYKNQQEYQKIDALLQECEIREIRNQFLDYMASPPSYDMESGTYREKINVKLIANAAGTLYYTLDGSEPTINSEVYTVPFSLESGTFEIRAIFVNQYGVMSQTSTARYHVDVSRPDAPVVSPESGEFYAPGYISVEVPEKCKVYYTTDGKTPDSTSSQYKEPFPMPAGNSSFRFVVYDEGGICGEVTERQYNLKLNAALSMEAASNKLALVLKEAGVLQNLRGDVSDKSGRNLYVYKYALTIQDSNYYLYREYYEETSGNSNMTGNDYVVNYMTGESFKAVRQADGSYELLQIQNLETSGVTQESRS